MKQGIIPWSYSSLAAFETCPRRFELTRIKKTVKEPQTEATIHGNQVHQAIEHHLNGDKYLPEKYAQYLPLVEKVKKAPGKRLVEFKFALTEGFKPTTFTAANAWVRGVIDFGVLTPKTGVILDWKTGKPREDSDQLKLFAGATFASYPYLEKVKTGFVWLAHNKITSQEFTKDDVAGIWQEFLPRVVRLKLAATKGNFPPKPSGLCKDWCPVTNRDCEFSGRT